MLLIQIAGSLLVCFTFAFPVISASRVTARYSEFYFNLAMECRIDGMPELSVLRTNSGFRVYGFCVTTKTAIFIFVACFANIIKVPSWFH